ncbi:alpha-hydroxy-acid oxidizing protein [Faecalimonas sp.]
MVYNEVLEQARQEVGPYCKACPVCNGKACKNQMPGPGAKGIGDTAIRNYEKWKEIRLQMDTIGKNQKADTTLNIFGKTFRYPLFAGPVGAVNLHYGKKYNDESYNNILVSACAEAGIVAMTGDGVNDNVMKVATEAIRKANGIGIPTVKPWDMEKIKEKMQLADASGAFAVAMDIDAAGLPFLQAEKLGAGRKSVEELHLIAKSTYAPFIVKGVMTVRGALKAEAAGADAIVVSNHGGRVLDQCPATAEVLEEIANAVKGKLKIFVDGGIRSGTDIFKAIALGADGVIICRPFVTALYGGGEEGVKLYINKIGQELTDAMEMCGANSLKDITKEMIWRS